MTHSILSFISTKIYSIYFIIILLISQIFISQLLNWLWTYGLHTPFLLSRCVLLNSKFQRRTCLSLLCPEIIEHVSHETAYTMITRSLWFIFKKLKSKIQNKNLKDNVSLLIVSFPR